jgi:hypothetical protein
MRMHKQRNRLQEGGNIVANCEYQYPALTVEKKHGDECFLNGCCSAHLVDFWRWAYSDLMGNTERGKLAEYIVSLAMHCANGVSEGWRAFDVLTLEGIKNRSENLSLFAELGAKKDIQYSF